MNKKLLVFLLVCVLALPTALNVFAANTNDMPINFDVNATNFNVKTGARNKEKAGGVQTAQGLILTLGNNLTS